MPMTTNISATASKILDGRPLGSQTARYIAKVADAAIQERRLAPLELHPSKPVTFPDSFGRDTVYTWPEVTARLRGSLGARKECPQDSIFYHPDRLLKKADTAEEKINWLRRRGGEQDNAAAEKLEQWRDSLNSLAAILVNHIRPDGDYSDCLHWLTMGRAVSQQKIAGQLQSLAHGDIGDAFRHYHQASRGAGKT